MKRSEFGDLTLICSRSGELDKCDKINHVHACPHSYPHKFSKWCDHITCPYDGGIACCIPLGIITIHDDTEEEIPVSAV